VSDDDNRSIEAPPLYLAALHGHTKCVRLLLDHGADPNLIYYSDHHSDPMEPHYSYYEGDHAPMKKMAVHASLYQYKDIEYVQI